MHIPLSVIRKTSSAASFRERSPATHTLNVGGTGMQDAVNFDLQWDADVKGDAHELSAYFEPDTFDRVICTAVLQLCPEPARVVSEIRRVLAPGGLVYIDVPWVQPACEDGACKDLWRFSDHGLRHLFRDFDIVDVGVSIPAVSAIGFYMVKLEPTPSRYANAALRWCLGLAFGVLALTKAGRAPGTAGGFYLVARKPVEGREDEDARRHA